MKLTILLCLLFPVGIFAQNWMPVLPGETYHYRLTDSAYITHSIRVDSTKVEGADVVYYLNRVLKWEGPVGTQIAFYKQGQFLGKTMTQKPDGSLVFASDNIFFDTSIVIFPGAYLGQTWVAVAESGVMATVIDTDEGPVFDTQDSIKTILFSNGAEWILSKNYGLVGATDFNQGNHWVFLSGLENQGIGDRLYRFEDFFDFNVGDVFEYISSSSYLTGWTDIHLKTKILEKTSLSDGFLYLVEKRSKIVQGGLINQTSYDINIEQDQYLKQDYNFLGGYNNEAISILGNPGLGGKITYLKHFNGGIRVGSDNSDTCSVFYIPDDPNNWLSSVPDALDCIYGHFFEEYRPKLGQIHHSIELIDDIYAIHLTGAIVQGDTIWGSITPDWYFTETSEPNPNRRLVVSPNPSSGFATVQIPEAVENGVIQLFNADGRCVRTQDFQNLKSVSLDLSALPTGIYFLTLRSEDRIWQARLTKNTE